MGMCISLKHVKFRRINCISLCCIYTFVLLLMVYFNTKLVVVDILGPEIFGNYTLQMLPNLQNLINWTNPEYPINVSYRLENDELCTSVQDLKILIVVNSATDHFDRRQAIRKTWANNSYYSHLGTVRVLFLLGMNVSIQEAIKKESEIFGDILQGDFIDTYLNLTHKGVMAFKWITERCRNAEMILKVDDDFVINMFLYFEKLTGPLKHINVYCELMNVNIPRDTSSKWFVSNEHFRGETHYKEYCEGKFVSMTNDIIPSLYESATKTPFFPYDDVLLFGYVMHNIPGLRYRSEPQSMTRNHDVGMKCLNEQKTKCDKIVIAANSDEEIEKTWSIIIKHFSAVTRPKYNSSHG